MILEDVHLAARRPADGADVLAQHPEGGPEPLPRGELDACFDPTLIGEHLGVGGDLRGRVAAPPVVTRDAVSRDARDDLELARAVQLDIRGDRKSTRLNSSHSSISY